MKKKYYARPGGWHYHKRSCSMLNESEELGYVQVFVPSNHTGVLSVFAPFRGEFNPCPVCLSQNRKIYKGIKD